MRQGDVVVDLGGGSGEFMELFEAEEIECELWVADISKDELERAQERGFRTLLLTESSALPFGDGEVDLIFCNSVIEHCTIPKASIWSVTDEEEFKCAALKAQAFFAGEIERVSKKYFVQTPSRSFPIESHTLFPFLGAVPRPYGIAAMKVLNRFWFKKTSPDWNLLDRSEMEALFPNGRVMERRWMGLSKEIIAYRG